MRAERHDQITLPGGFVPDENRYEVIRSLFKSENVKEIWKNQLAMISVCIHFHKFQFSLLIKKTNSFLF